MAYTPKTNMYHKMWSVAKKEAERAGVATGHKAKPVVATHVRGVWDLM